MIHLLEKLNYLRYYVFFLKYVSTLHSRNLGLSCLGYFFSVWVVFVFSAAYGTEINSYLVVCVTVTDCINKAFYIFFPPCCATAVSVEILKLSPSVSVLSNPGHLHV